MDQPISRRSLLRGLASFAGAGVVASFRGRSSTKHGPAPLARGSLTASASTVYRSLPDFRPPSVTVDVRHPGTAPGVVLTDCHDGSGQQGPIIIGDNGGLVWFLPISDHGTAEMRAFDLRVQQFQGKPVLTWFQGAVVGNRGLGHYMIFDTSYRQMATVEAADGMIADCHEFLLTESGTAVFTVYGSGTADLSGLGGAHEGSYFYGEVQEVEVTTGKLLFSWRSDRHVEFQESYVAPPSEGQETWDYFHINSVGIDPSDGNLVISSRNCWAFYKVNRKTGAVMWRLGGKRSDFSMGPGTGFAFQHDVTPHLGGVYTVFDNESVPSVRPPSRALVLKLDEARRRATLLHQYHHSPPVTSDSAGSVQILPNGHVFVGWGTSTYFTEYEPSGAVLYDARLDTEGLAYSYRAFKQPWSGQPSEPPALAAERLPDTTALYVSWNGATGVASWRVLAAGSAGSLKAVGTAPKMGLETLITLPTHPSRVAVEALDAAGLVLARSGLQYL